MKKIIIKIRKAFKDEHGGVITENGIVIAIILVVAIIVLSLLGPYIKDVWFPMLAEKITSFFSMA